MEDEEDDNKDIKLTTTQAYDVFLKAIEDLSETIKPEQKNVFNNLITAEQDYQTLLKRKQRLIQREGMRAKFLLDDQEQDFIELQEKIKAVEDEKQQLQQQQEYLSGLEETLETQKNELARKQEEVNRIRKKLLQQDQQLVEKIQAADLKYDEAFDEQQLTVSIREEYEKKLNAWAKEESKLHDKLKKNQQTIQHLQQQLVTQKSSFDLEIEILTNQLGEYELANVKAANEQLPLKREETFYSLADEMRDTELEEENNKLLTEVNNLKARLKKAQQELALQRQKMQSSQTPLLHSDNEDDDSDSGCAWFFNIFKRKRKQKENTQYYAHVDDFFRSNYHSPEDPEYYTNTYDL